MEPELISCRRLDELDLEGGSRSRAVVNVLRLALTFLLCAASGASASVFVVEGTVTYWDERDHRSDTPGSAVRIATQNQNRPLENLVLEIVDQDGLCRDVSPFCDEEDDDVLGKTTTAWNTGRFRFRGKNGEGIGNREDIYLRTPMRAGWGQILDWRGDPLWITSETVHDFGTGLPSGNFVFDWSVGCFRATACSSNAAAHDPTYDVNHGASARMATEAANVLATAIEADRRFGGDVLNGGAIEFYLAPSQPRNACTKAYGDNNNRAVDSNTVCVKTPFKNHRVAHEIGHIIHRRALRLQDGQSISSCLNGHFFEKSEQYEECATAEGWANFFGTAVHFDRSATDPFYIKTERTMEGGTSLGNGSFQIFGLSLPRVRQCLDQDSTPHDVEGNVSRFFWDLYDSTTISDSLGGTLFGYDDASYSMAQLVDVWQDFDVGSADGETRETGVDGRNAWDFHGHLPAVRSELYLNCLCRQEQSSAGLRFSCRGAY